MEQLLRASVPARRATSPARRRLEHRLDRFEAELAEHRRRVTEAEARLPGYRRRLGEGFDLQEELDAKRVELKALEDDLAANTKAAADDDAVPDVMAA